ncbi:hypothetical protein ACKI14_02840 [Streptomyces turgidiscabies]|uniref:hypothetical protein n=1 Tax=Streptomyces turgidiscabies TaxID=85558 RepID=UPI0038F66930
MLPVRASDRGRLDAPRLPRPDTTSADATSLERMSRLPTQPVPAQWSGLFVEPDFPPESPPAE